MESWIAGLCHLLLLDLEQIFVPERRGERESERKRKREEERVRERVQCEKETLPALTCCLLYAP